MGSGFLFWVVRKIAKGKYEYWLTPEGLLLIEGWARDGLTNEQIAEKMGVTQSTLYDWQKKYSEISESLKKGKEVVDRQVEQSLLKRALGYDYEEVTEALVEGEMQVVKVVKKHVVADVGAIAFWLKNRKPDDYREKREYKIDTQKIPVVIAGGDQLEE